MKLVVTGEIDFWKKRGDLSSDLWGSVSEKFSKIVLSDDEWEVKKAYSKLRKGDTLVIDPFPSMHDLPEYNSANWRMKLLEKTARNNKINVLVFSAHSSSLPYALTEKRYNPEMHVVQDGWPHPYLDRVLAKEIGLIKGSYLQELLSVGDVTLSFTFPDSFNMDTLSKELSRNHLKNGIPAEFKINYCKSSMIYEPEPVLDTKNHSLEIQIREDNPALFDYHILRNIGYLIGMVSEQYTFVSAAGLIIGDKGILLLGEGKSGKSTLTSNLECEVLHEDFLLTSSSAMKRITPRLHNAVDYWSIEKKMSKDCQHNLDYVFVLDRSLEAGKIKQINSSEIKPEMTFDSELHASLYKPYTDNFKLFLEKPCYLLGTGGNHPANILKTKDEILKKIN